MYTVNLIKCPTIIVTHLFPGRTIVGPCYIPFSSKTVITFCFYVQSDKQTYNIKDYPLRRDNLEGDRQELFDLVATNTTHEPRAANMALEFLASTLSTGESSDSE